MSFEEILKNAFTKKPRPAQESKREEGQISEKPEESTNSDFQLDTYQTASDEKKHDEEFQKRNELLKKQEELRARAEKLLMSTEYLKEKISALGAGTVVQVENLESDQLYKYPETYSEIRENLAQEQKIQKVLLYEACIKVENMLEKRGSFTLSKDDFKKYFSSNEFVPGANLKQGNTGDCYLVAALHALSCSPRFELICRSSIKKLFNGSWQVKIPLLDPDGETIEINKDDLSFQMNKKFLSWEESMPDTRLTLHSLSGSEGFRVLEAAYIKSKFGKLDRLSSEGGHSNEVLQLFSEKNFKKYQLTVFSQTGSSNLNQTYDKNIAYVDHFLENFDPEIYIASANITSKKSWTDRYKRAPGTMKFFVHSHSYSISQVDKDKKIVYLHNPWDTSKKLSLTFNQFKETFGEIDGVRIDYYNLLTNALGVAEKQSKYNE